MKTLPRDFSMEILWRHFIFDTWKYTIYIYIYILLLLLLLLYFILFYFFEKNPKYNGDTILRFILS
jgi:hypothetical protein